MACCTFLKLSSTPSFSLFIILEPKFFAVSVMPSHFSRKNSPTEFVISPTLALNTFHFSVTELTMFCQICPACSLNQFQPSMSFAFTSSQFCQRYTNAPIIKAITARIGLANIAFPIPKMAVIATFPTHKNVEPNTWSTGATKDKVKSKGARAINATPAMAVNLTIVAIAPLFWDAN